jgi:hypothetical protein
MALDTLIILLLILSIVAAGQDEQHEHRERYPQSSSNPSHFRLGSTIAATPIAARMTPATMTRVSRALGTVAARQKRALRCFSVLGQEGAIFVAQLDMRPTVHSIPAVAKQIGIHHLAHQPARCRKLRLLARITTDGV